MRLQTPWKCPFPTNSTALDGVNARIMNQFNSEIEANESRAKLDALNRASGGPAFAVKLLGLVQRLINPASQGFDSLSEAAGDLALSLREDREHRSLREIRYLLETVVLEVKRHDSEVDSLKDRFNRLEAGIQAAIRYPTDGRNETIRRVAVVIVRGAFTFPDNPQEQTDEFLRIASQITDSEVSLLRIIVNPRLDWPRRWANSICPRCGRIISRDFGARWTQNTNLAWRNGCIVRAPWFACRVMDFWSRSNGSRRLKAA